MTSDRIKHNSNTFEKNIRKGKTKDRKCGRLLLACHVVTCLPMYIEARHSPCDCVVWGGRALAWQGLLKGSRWEGTSLPHIPMTHCVCEPPGLVGRGPGGTKGPTVRTYWTSCGAGAPDCVLPNTLAKILPLCAERCRKSPLCFPRTLAHHRNTAFQQ